VAHRGDDALLRVVRLALESRDLFEQRDQRSGLLRREALAARRQDAAYALIEVELVLQQEHGRSEYVLSLRIVEVERVADQSGHGGLLLARDFAFLFQHTHHQQRCRLHRPLEREDRLGAVELAPAPATGPRDRVEAAEVETGTLQ